MSSVAEKIITPLLRIYDGAFWAIQVIESGKVMGYRTRIGKLAELERRDEARAKERREARQASMSQAFKPVAGLTEAILRSFKGP